ncbi:hypothetical protein GH714_000704 [Hevea brasiliensis]|uniref:Endoplasmic reticulum transmembrane protein n=1 Tax=Hevea brasiliensis TaxID=3981 RepID=A0A6A6LX48_HEVBR|nr:hypothetical protein GH714_000704 [Hevea brasiliensis]
MTVMSQVQVQLAEGIMVYHIIRIVRKVACRKPALDIRNWSAEIVGDTELLKIGEIKFWYFPSKMIVLSKEVYQARKSRHSGNLTSEVIVSYTKPYQVNQLQKTFRMRAKNLLSLEVSVDGSGSGQARLWPNHVKTVAGTVFVVLMSSVYSMMKIQKRWIDEGAVNPTDQVLMAKNLLEATLMGSSLFLALMIDRLHHYIRELRVRRKSMEAVKKQNQVFEDGKVEESKALEKEVITLQAKLKQLESDWR